MEERISNDLSDEKAVAVVGDSLYLHKDATVAVVRPLESVPERDHDLSHDDVVRVHGHETQDEYAIVS